MEGATEGVHGGVTDVGGDGLEAVVGVSQPVGGEIHPPPGEVLAGRGAGERREASYERLLGRRDLLGESLRGPGASGGFVDSGDGLEQEGVAEHSPPRGVDAGVRGDPGSEDLDEEDVDEPVEDEVGGETGTSEFSTEESDNVGEVGVQLLRSEVDHGRKKGEDGRGSCSVV